MRVLKSITIKQKLIILCSLVLLALSTVIASTVYQMAQIRDELTAIAEENIPMTELVSEVVIKQLEQAISFERALHFGVYQALSSNTHDAASRYNSNRDRFFKLDAEVNDLFVRSESFLKTLEEHADSQSNRDKLIEFEKKTLSIDHAHKQYTQHVTEVFKALESNNVLRAETLAAKIEVEEDQLNSAVEHLLIDLGKYTEASAIRAEQHEEQALTNVLIISLIAMIMVVVFCILISRSITRKIAHVRDAVGEISINLDLTKRVDIRSKDELGELSTDLDHLLNNLLSSVSNVVNASSQLAAASEELSTISVQNSASMEKQSSATDEVADAIQKLSDSSIEVARISLQATEAANTADIATRNGLNVVGANLAAMRNLEHKVDSATQTISQLNEDSKNISAVLDVIQSVAEQTNLLALNAAIEAARAGEAGRGFAVVADEVRELANRTHRSTKDIRTLIESLQTGSERAEVTMQASQHEANEVARQAEIADEALANIAQAVTEITRFSRQISESAEEQSHVAGNVNKNVMMIRSSAQESSETTRQTTESSEALSELACSLQDTGARFKIG
ncbi:methyl-accepting chemotaxis protein [Pontibacterium sp. N1Y112]|uniref:Methyl-accepting chemotaxis protein n=1 Tax=Pontibacterium sinense TaxID=2781979 RepID=A0A8J7JXV2_9GAMM|nr:methyl-accepting chemotaxis protein [Pontibacterium sinense]MBE9396693.1 methyl-accepting chemotaxis protein [Pontibacterium sinense]